MTSGRAEHQVQRFPEKQSDLFGGNPPAQRERTDRPAKPSARVLSERTGRFAEKREGTDRSDRRQSTGSGQESGAKGGLRRRIQYDHSLDGLLRRSGHDRFEHRSQGRARNSINGNASTTKSVRFEIRSGRFISSKSPFRAAEIREIQHILPLPTRTPCRRIILARQRLHTQPRPPQ